LLAQPPAGVGGDPGVIAAPDDADRDVDLAQARLELGEVALVGLLDLAIEGRLAVSGDPRRQELREVRGAQAAAAGALDVGGDDGLVDVRR
jgi:hypothetical protein